MPTLLTLQEIAARLNVTIATVRNWIKEGWLTTYEGKVPLDSMQLFERQWIGKTKLVSRANKTMKQTRCAAKEKASNPQQYEAWLGESRRNAKGIYYTPQHIADDMMEAVADVGDKRFLEPCCGSGNFVMAALKIGIRPENIVAFDNDPVAVETTRQRVFEATGYHGDTIRCGDFLELFDTLPRHFDLVFTNPPWGAKEDRDHYRRLARLLGAEGCDDSGALFFLAALRVLPPNGRLGFLLPGAFFNIAGFETARRTALARQIDMVKDYGKPFKTLMTNAVAITLTNRAPSAAHTIDCHTLTGSHQRRQESFKNTPRHIFNYVTLQEEADHIEHLFNIPHLTLKDNALWAMGIVTGNNAALCQQHPFPGGVPVVRGKDITPQGLKAPSLYIADLGRCQQVAPMERYMAKEKLIYRFISKRLVFYCDRQQRLILNSANLLIPDDRFPVSCQQLADMLNSDTMNWLFSKLFGTRKVLRSDLERLPIYHRYFLGHPVFDEASFMQYLGISPGDIRQ